MFKTYYKGNMKSRSVVFVGIFALVVGAIYISSSIFQIFVEAEIVSDVSCSPQEGGKTYCCASVLDMKGKDIYPTTYCTTCDNTNPPSNCTPREKPKAVVNPGRDLSNILQGGALGGAATLPEASVLEGQRANISILPGGILQAENNLTFSEMNNSNNDSSNTLATAQSDLESEEQGSDSVKGKRTVEQQDSTTSEDDSFQEGADVDVPQTTKNLD